MGFFDKLVRQDNDLVGLATQVVGAATQRRREQEEDPADDRASRSLRAQDDEAKRDPASQVLAAVPAVAGVAQNFGVRMPVGVSVDDQGLHVGAKGQVGGGEVGGQVDIHRDGSTEINGTASMGAGPAKMEIGGNVTRDAEGKVAANGNAAVDVDAGPVKGHAGGSVHRDAEGKTTADYDASVGVEGGGAKANLGATGKRDAEGTWVNDENASVEYENAEAGVNAHAKGGLHHADGKTTAEYDAGAQYQKGGVDAQVGATGKRDAEGTWVNDERASVEYENEEAGVNAHAKGGLHHADGKTTAEYDAGAQYKKDGVDAQVGATGKRDAGGTWGNDERASVEYENEEAGVNAHAKGGLHHADGTTTAEYDAGAQYKKDGVDAQVGATGKRDAEGTWVNDESASVEYENAEAGVNAHAKGGLHHADGTTTAEYDAGAQYKKDGVDAQVGATGKRDAEGTWVNDERASVEYENEEAGVNAHAKGGLHHADGKTTAEYDAGAQYKKDGVDAQVGATGKRDAEGTWVNDERASVEYENEEAGVNAHAKGGLHHADGKTTAEYDAGAQYKKDGVDAQVGATGKRDAEGTWVNDESASVEYENEEAGVKASAHGELHHAGGKTTGKADAHGELHKGPLDATVAGKVARDGDGKVTGEATGHAGVAHGDDHAAVDGHVARHADGKVDGEAKATWNIRGHAGEKILAGGGEHEGGETESVDLRGEHRPQVGQHTQAIDQLAGGDLEDEGAEHEHQADESESAPANDNQPIPDDVKDVGQVDNEVQARKARAEAEGQARQAKVERKHDVAKHHVAADKKRQLAGQHGQHAAQTQRQSVVAAKQKKVATKDELRAKLTGAATTQKAKLEADVTAQKAKLDEKLAAEFTKLEEVETKEQAKLQRELDKRTGTLEADIAKKREAHTKQIAKERVDLDKKDTTEQASLRAKAKADAETIKAEADKQAAATADHAKLKANDLSIKGMTEAGGATVDANRKAEQAINAANARAAKVPADEATKVRAEGESRAAMARAAGERKKAEILAKAKADGDAIKAKGAADAEAQKQAGAERAAAAVKSGEEQAGKVHAATVAAIAAMQAKSDAAVAEMNAEVAKMKADVAAKQAEITAKAASRRAELKTKAEAEKARALAQIDKEYQDALKTIDAKVTADLAKIDAASDKDLAALERQVDHDIAQIEAAVRRAEQRIDQQVKAAERKVHAQCLAEKAKIHADTCRVVGQLDRMAFQAKQRIAAADKDTKNEIHAAHQQGVADVEAASQKAATDLQAGNEALLKATEEQGAADRAAADKAAAESGKAMEGQRADLDKEINKEWVDDAVKKANEKLDDSGIFNVVTDGEATDAMNILNSLPADLQGDAVEKLDKDAFDNLLDEVPEKRRAEFDTLITDTHDPERKLKLWGEQHKSQVALDAAKEKEKTADEGHWYWRTDEQKHNRFLNKRRDEIIDSTRGEVDDEMKVLLDKQKAGTLTEADVQAVMDRKKREHEIEMKFNVNLTNQEGTRKDGSKIAWTPTELDQLESALGRAPADAVRDNEALKKIERRQLPDDGDKGTRGDHSGGVINIYDAVNDPTRQHSGDKRQLADPSLAPAPGSPLSTLEMVVDHELGHDVADKNPAVVKKYEAAVDWKTNVGDDDMKKAGLTDAQIAELHQAAKDGKHKEFTVNGRVFETSSYKRDGDVSSFRDGAIPNTDAVPSEQPAATQDTWWYARRNPADNFAEHYTKAIHLPETLAKDMIDAPQKRVDQATAQRDQANADLAAEKAKTPPDPAKVAALEANAKSQQEALDDATADQTARKTQYDLMRNEIFHADKETEDAAARLAAKGVDPAKIKEFRDKAARAQTPQQVKLIESQY